MKKLVLLAVLLCCSFGFADEQLSPRKQRILEQLRILEKENLKLEQLRMQLNKSFDEPEEEERDTTQTKTTNYVFGVVGDWVYNSKTKQWDMKPDVNPNQFYYMKMGRGSIAGFGPRPMLWSGMNKTANQPKEIGNEKCKDCPP